MDECINKKCMYYEKNKTNPNSCLTEIDINICPNHLKAQKEPVADGRRNDGLCASPIPEEVLNGYAVYMELDDKAKQRTTSENVSDVLDSVARLIRQRIGA